MLARQFLAAAAALILAVSGPGRGTADARGPESRATPGDPRPAAATSPAFLENGGRLPSEAAFTLDAADRTFFFGADGVTVALRDPARPEAGRWVMKLAFDGARAVLPAAEGERPGVTNLFKGPKESWHVGLRSFGRIVYRDLWPGVDLTWTAGTGRLTWRCDVHPGADPSRIRFGVRGAESVSVRPDGSLVASTPLGDFAETAPIAWTVPTVPDPNFQVSLADVASAEAAGAKPENLGLAPYVAAAFRLDAATSTIRVALGEYDATRDLVIDPSTVVRAGFIGGALSDVATSVATDAFRNVYVAGITNSPETSFPTLFGPDQTYNGGTGDAYVCKIDSSFRAVWTGYIGGTFADGAAGIAVDLVGAVYVAGSTFSPDFPVVGGPTSSGARGGLDAFVTKIAPNGQSLVWSAVLGGPAEDRAFAVAVDRLGHVVVAGRTSGGMPWSGVYGGGVSDAYAFGLRNDGSFIEWGTYIGGKLADWANGVAIDASFNVYLCGNTLSTQTSFPVKAGPGVVAKGGQDAWVAKLDSVTHSVLYAGYIGGAAGDSAAGIAVDSLGRAYVVGSTLSDEFSFPVVVGPHLVRHGKSEAFVARVTADGHGLEYCGFIGGTGDDVGFGIALDGNRRAYVVGTTGSTPAGYAAARAKFPVVDGPDLTFNGGVHDGWIGVVEPDGAQMASLGYVGGSGNVDDVTAVALHVNGDIVVVGDTMSSASSFPAGTGPLLVSSGGREAFVAQLQYSVPSPLLLVPQIDAVTANGFAVDVDWTDVDLAETGFDIERASADGTSALFSVTSTAGTTGPVHFTDTTASPGTRYVYRVRGVATNVAGEFSEGVLVKTTPSLNLTVKSGSLTGAGVDFGGTAALRLKYSFQPGSAAASLGVVADGISFTIAGPGTNQVVAVPPNDPNWTVTGSVSSWVDPVPGGASIVVDTAKHTIRLDAAGLSFAAAAAHNAIRIEVTSGAAHGARTADWRGIGGLRYAYP